MKNSISTIVMLGFSALSLAPNNSWALSQDACTNNAVPRTTPSSNFTVIGDGSSVRHDTSGLEWRRCAVGQTWDGATCTGSATGHTWRGALDVAAAAGDGWRLPNINELGSIVEECRTKPAINRVVFPETTWCTFWSASPYTGDLKYAWGVEFTYGYDGGTNKLFGNRVRLVRGGQ